MSLAHREMIRALETKRRLEQLDKQAERFKSICRVDVSAIQEATRRMEIALSFPASRLCLDNGLQEMVSRMETAFIQNIVSHLEVSKISFNIGNLVPDNINFTEIHNKIINDFQKIFNNWVIPNPFINMPTLRIGISPINLSEPTIDIEGSNKNPNTTENDTDNIDQEFEFDKSSLLDSINLSFEITKLCNELDQDRKMIWMIILPTLISHSILQGLLDRSDNVWVPILGMLGNCLLYKWSDKSH